MASNDGSRLTVFGLSFRQYDSRHMQQILRQYSRLPSNPGNRAALYTGLFDLSRELQEDEIIGITSWLEKGGIPDDFPAPELATPVLTKVETDQDIGHDIEDGEVFGEYNEADFEHEDTEMNDAESAINPESTSTEEDTRITPESLRNDTDSGEGEEVLSGESYSHPTRTIRGVSDTTENECDICYDVLKSADLLAPLKITSTCEHFDEKRCCYPCMAEHISMCLERFALNDINCPSCDEKLSLAEIKKYATSEDFSRYEYLCFIALSDTVMCLGSGCGSRQSHANTTDPKMICNTCSFAMCVPHKCRWHEGMTCEEFDCDDSQIERLEEAEATAKLLAKDHSKICPSCNQGVSKQEGCDHLQCLCGKEWCYVCLASWDNIVRIGDEAHAPTCDYHPRKRQKTKAQQAAGQAQLTERLMGVPASEALLRARGARNERIRAGIRLRALEAAEARLRVEREREDGQEKESGRIPKKKRTRLLPAWEEH